MSSGAMTQHAFKFELTTHASTETDASSVHKSLTPTEPVRTAQSWLEETFWQTYRS